MIKKIKEFLTSNFVKRAFWIMLASVLSYGAVYFQGASEWYAIILTGFLASASKELNNYLSE